MKMPLRIKVCSPKEQALVKQNNHRFEKCLVFDQAALILLPSEQDC